jgi:glycine/D-amino acid oxidase-like deaminating enzyme
VRRREFLRNAGAGLVSATTIASAAQAANAALAAGPSARQVASEASPPAQDLLVPPCQVGVPTVTTPEGPVPVAFVRAEPDRIVSLTVCTRPFRATGVRLESERLGRKTIVHNYGHGGSGWSLSWGSATLAVRQVLTTRVNEIAVIGAGVIGLTSAIMAQRAGLKVRIYAKDRWPDTRSTFATGNWSPNSRYCTAEGATPEVAQRWEEMARISFRMYQNLLGLPGDPIEWRDGYYLADSFRSNHPSDEPEYPGLEARIADLTPRGKLLDPGTHPFPTQIARRFTNMFFNLSAYSRMLMSDFLAAGGAFEAREFGKPDDIAKLREKTVIHCTGYGARALFGDESITPVRGQLMRLIPQPEVTYALQYEDKFFMAPRRDGILLQTTAPGDFGNADIAPDRAAAERTVQSVADLNERIRANLPCK